MTDQERQQIEWAHMERENARRIQAEENDRLEKERRARKRQQAEAKRDREILEKRKERKKLEKTQPKPIRGNPSESSQDFQWRSPGLAVLFGVLGLIACLVGEIGAPAAGLVVGALVGYFIRVIFVAAMVAFIILLVAVMIQ